MIQNGPVWEAPEPEEPTQELQPLPVDYRQDPPDWLISPRCSCGRELELRVEVHGIHESKDEACHGPMYLVFCKECGQVVRSLFDPYHLSCNLDKHAYAPTQLMV